jgi:exopolysaccharide biosynthesis polyprenyl glycosylphosphotransferase
VKLWRLRLQVMLAQLASVVTVTTAVFVPFFFLSPLDIPIMSGPRLFPFVVVSLMALWMAQLILLWNPSEFTSNKNFFRPASIGKSSIVMLLSIVILAASNRSLWLLVAGFGYVALGAIVLLIAYGIIRQRVRRLANTTWLPRGVKVLSSSRSVENLSKTLGRPLAPPGHVTELSRATSSDEPVSVAFSSVLTDDTPHLGALQEASTLIVAPDRGIDIERYQSVLSSIQQAGIDSVVMTNLGAESADKVSVLLLHDETAIVIRGNKPSRAFEVTKRFIDVIVSSIGLIVLSPLMAVIAVAVRLDSPGKAVFTSTRVGRNETPFTMYKFRSMHEGAHAAHEALYQQRPDLADGGMFKEENDARVTKLGYLLRRSSLDELPQLWNILRGDMSLVGPRPLHAIELQNHHEREKQRLLAVPGLTGMWQVNGRSLLSWEESIELDLLYVTSQSIWLDITILARTIPTVLSGRGAF